MESSQYIERISHPLPPVWNTESEVLLLGTMPSPASRKSGFFYMHPQNRFWKVLPALFGESLSLPNNANDIEGAAEERKDFLLRHRIALWDVLAECDIHGAADSTIRNAVPNDFTEIFTRSKIRRVFCTGKTAFKLWQKHCEDRYRPFNIQCGCLPSTSPANAAWTLEKLVEAYKVILEQICKEPSEMRTFESFRNL